MKLSIIVPFYNMAHDKKLNFCMDSLVNQTMQEGSYEILAVDDCSPDNTFEELKKYEQKYPDKVRAFQTPFNKKQGGARNLGMSHAKGQWIGFMDGDDWAALDMYEKLVKKGESTGADVVGCDLHQTYEHSMKIGKIVNANTIDQTGKLDAEKYKKLMLNPCSMVIKIYRREVIETHHLCFPEGIFYEDNCAAPIWMLCCTHFEKVEEPLYYYYQEPASTTHYISTDKCRDRMKAGKLLVEECKKYGFYEPYRTELEFSFTRLYYVNTLFTYMIGVKHTRQAFLKELKKGILQEFPDFQENSYFAKNLDGEQKKLIKLHMKSDLLFTLYYKALYLYRGIRKGLRKNKRIIK